MWGPRNTSVVHKRLGALTSAVAACLLLAACSGSGGGGGGDDGGTQQAAISGDVSAPVSPPSAQPLEHFARDDVLIPPAALPVSFPSIAQIGTYRFDGDVLPSALKVTSFELMAPKTTDAYFMPFADSTAFSGDPTLAKPTGMQFLLPGDGASTPSGVSTIADDTFGDLPALSFTYAPPGAVTELMEYVIPFSAVINPDGYTFQTFGAFGTFPADLTFEEGYFSTGVPTVTAFPGSGTATYAGKVQGSLVVAATRDPGGTGAAVAVSVDFVARTVTITTSGTTNLSDNAAPGALPVASPELNFSGTLTYAAGSNTFSGTVTAANGMTGNATGRFYGAGIASTTATKVAGSAPEVGGTFGMFAPGVGAMQGAFGAK